MTGSASEATRNMSLRSKTARGRHGLTALLACLAATAAATALAEPDHARGAKARKTVAVGMTSAEVRASSLGAPTHVARLVGPPPSREVWVYDLFLYEATYLTFENGVLSRIR